MSGEADPVLSLTPPPTGIERRVAPRFPLNLSTSCRLLAAAPDRTLNARVRNISASGISLVVSRVLDPETVFQIELKSVARNLTRHVKVRVVYCIEHPCGELIVGGQFVEPIAEADLRCFVR